MLMGRCVLCWSVSMPSDEKHVRIGVVVCCLLLLPMIFFGVS